MSDLQNELKTFQNAISEMRNSLGIIGEETSGGKIPDVSDLRERFFESATTAAITQTVSLELNDKTVKLERINRIEHQSWIRGIDTNGDLQVIDLMDVNKISTDGT